MESGGIELVALGVIWYLVFLFSTTCHEGAHALAAKLGGDLTAFHGGQVTLNPLPHIQREPFGTVLVPIASFVLSKGGWMLGWASAPYDPIWAERYPRRAAWMALAGPAANFALMLVAAIAIREGVFTGVFNAPARANFAHIAEAAQPGGWEFVATLLSVLFMLNLLLGTFNLLPIPPLDGNTAITLLMSEQAGHKFREFSQTFGLIGLILAFALFNQLFDHVFTVALNLLHPGAHYH